MPARAFEARRPDLALEEQVSEVVQGAKDHGRSGNGSDGTGAPPAAAQNYLLDSHFQLKYSGYLVLIAVVLSVSLGSDSVAHQPGGHRAEPGSGRSGGAGGLARPRSRQGEPEGQCGGPDEHRQGPRLRRQPGAGSRPSRSTPRCRTSGSGISRPSSRSKRRRCANSRRIWRRRQRTMFTTLVGGSTLLVVF